MHFLPGRLRPVRDVQAARATTARRSRCASRASRSRTCSRCRSRRRSRFFAKIPKLRRRLQTLHDVGLDYIKLGQPATTLSGGEAQRVKLAAELSKVATGRTLYILDEPTTGLHFADIEKLLEVLQRLVDAGNTVLVIEHNLDVIKQADWIVDLGPEGGEAGGEIVAAGTPEEVAEVEESLHRPVPPRHPAEGRSRRLGCRRVVSRTRSRRRTSGLAAPRAARPPEPAPGLRRAAGRLRRGRRGAAGAGPGARLARGHRVRPGDPVAGRLLDDPVRRRLARRRLGVPRRRLYGVAVYFVGRRRPARSACAPSGATAATGARATCSRFAAAPLALSLARLLADPDRDLRRRPVPHRRLGRRTAATSSPTCFYVFVVWALVLLVVGVRTVHGWTWARARGDRRARRRGRRDRARARVVLGL